MVSDNFFFGIGVRPLAGRLLGAQDDVGGASPTVVISFRLWERQFDRDPDVLGHSVLLNGHGFTVVGVLPQEFTGVRPGAATDFYIPLASGSPDRWRVPLMARLKPGVNDARFQTALNVVFTRETETVMKQPSVLLTDGRAGPDLDRRRYRGPLILLLGVVGVVLLLACANLAGLNLARGAARHHEFAVRAALGSGRWRLMRQSLTESLLLALLGGGLGVAVAVWGKTAFSRLLSGSPEGLHYDIHLDLKVLTFALATTLVTALLSGLLPALRAASVDPRAGLKDRTTFGARRLRAGRVLVAAQIALSLMLLVGAGLYVRTLINLAQINPGFVAENLLLFKLNPGDAGRLVPPRSLTAPSSRFPPFRGYVPWRSPNTRCSAVGHGFLPSPFRAIRMKAAGNRRPTCSPSAKHFSRHWAFPCCLVGTCALVMLAKLRRPSS